MIDRLLVAVVLVLAACTLDLELGKRTCETSPAMCTCDPLDGADCPCANTAECPEHFYCINNTAGGMTGTCRPPDGCSLADRVLSCNGTQCEPNNTTSCMPEPTCSTTACSNNGHACCANDSRCYPANCIGCCQ